MSWTEILVLVLGNGAITAIITTWLNYRQQKKLIEIQREHALELKSWEFFKSIAGPTQKELLDGWAQLWNDIKGPSAGTKKFVDNFAKLIDRTFLYGSTNTVRLLVEMQENSYELGKAEETDELSRKAMALMSSIIASLKKDLTGTMVKPDDFLRLKLTDWKNVRSLFDKYFS